MNKVEELCDRALLINRGHMVLYGSVREIRKQYSDHAVMVRTESRIDGVAGVRKVEMHNGDVKLTLEPNATPQAVLRALLDRGIEIESYSIASLPLEDIFVKVVQEGLGLDRGMSGPPTADELLPAGGAR
jgi:ABC-2 type transport system ATP-binding protein